MVYCGQCGAIYGVIPVDQSSIGLDLKPEATETPTEGHTAIKELGNVDLSEVLPYSAQRIANEMRAANKGRNTSRYLRVIAPDGPPHCPTHKTEMTPEVVPTGYENEGKTLWVCPHYDDCKKWELAETE